MEPGFEKVCTKCGTLNDSRTLMCIRCGANLEMSAENKYAMFKGKMINETWFLILFAFIFGAYAFGTVVYVFPWIHDKLVWLCDEYVFNFYGKSDIIYIALEVIYSLIICLLNYATIAIILYSMLSSKFMKRSKFNILSVLMFCFIVLSFLGLTIYKHGLNIVIIIEHLISVLFVFPYIKGRLLKRSI